MTNISSPSRSDGSKQRWTKSLKREISFSMWKKGSCAIMITATLPGSDGVIRSERVQTARGVLTRPSRSLFLVEPTVSS
ncbi:hypothetical protein T12_7864 [Trichinella patagoniensis]|uniref:Uncharacterized protein n=1 Tax=Trichinella patagoniensis TaxID=990121 RepID=A0A0V0Z9R4_9BILA|nr:hypothetical protein T12_7864 [Trichinella patagoniensis]